MNTRKRSQCNKIVLYEAIGKYIGNSANKAYVDDTGRYWNGGHCPDCRNANRKLYKQSPKRKYKGLDKVAKVKRYCRQCNELLPKDRYFNCFKCLELLDSDDGELIYFQY